MTRRFVVTGSIEMEFIVEAESHAEAIQRMPNNISPQSVRAAVEDREARLTVVGWCVFCPAPIFAGEDCGSYNGFAVPVHLVPPEDLIPFGEDVCCRECAIQRGIAGE